MPHLIRSPMGRDLQPATMAAAILHLLTYEIRRFHQLSVLDPMAARAWVAACNPPFPPASNAQVGPLPATRFPLLDLVNAKGRAYIISITPFIQEHWSTLNVSLAAEIEKLNAEPVDMVCALILTRSPSNQTIGISPNYCHSEGATSWHCCAYSRCGNG